MEVWHPKTLAEAEAMLAHPGARAVAGGTALQLDWARGVERPGALVVLSNPPSGTAGQRSVRHIGAAAIPTETGAA